MYPFHNSCKLVPIYILTYFLLEDGAIRRLCVSDTFVDYVQNSFAHLLFYLILIGNSYHIIYFNHLQLILTRSYINIKEQRTCDFKIKCATIYLYYYIIYSYFGNYINTAIQFNTMVI